MLLRPRAWSFSSGWQLLSNTELCFFQVWHEIIKNRPLLRKAMNFQILKHTSPTPLFLFCFVLLLLFLLTNHLRTSSPRLEMDSFQTFWVSLDLSSNRQGVTQSEQVPGYRTGSLVTPCPSTSSSLWCACENWLLGAATLRDKMQTTQIIHFQGLLTEREIYLWNIYCSVSGENHVIIAKGKAWKVLYFA